MPPSRLFINIHFSTDNVRPDPDLRNMTIEGPSNRVQLVKQVIDFKILEIQKREYKPRDMRSRHHHNNRHSYHGNR